MSKAINETEDKNEWWENIWILSLFFPIVYLICELKGLKSSYLKKDVTDIIELWFQFLGLMFAWSGMYFAVLMWVYHMITDTTVLIVSGSIITAILIFLVIPIVTLNFYIKK